MAAMTAEQIYRALAVDAEGQSALRDSWNASWIAREALQDRAVDIQRVASKIESGWRGQAAGAASRGLGPIVADLGDAALQHDRAQDLQNRQMHEFADARSRVAPVPPAPTMQDPAAQLAGARSSGDLSYVEQAGVQIQQAARTAAAEHNVRVYDGYQTTSSSNTEAMPRQYDSLSRDSAPQQVHPAGSPGSGAGSGQAVAASGGAGGGSGGYTVPVSAMQSSAGSAAGAGGRGYTAPEQPVAGSGTGAASATGAPDTAARPGTSSIPPTALVGQGDGSTTRAPGSAGLGGLGGLGGAAGGGARAGGGRIGEVLGGRGAAGGVGARGGAGAAGTGGVRAGTAAAAAGAGGVAGRGSSMGAVPPGAAGAVGDPDRERKRRYQVDPTREEVYGEDALDAGNPSVLGEKKHPRDTQ